MLVLVESSCDLETNGNRRLLCNVFIVSLVMFLTLNTGMEGFD